MAQLVVDLEEWGHCSANDAGSPLVGTFLRDQAERALATRLSTSGILDIQELREGLALQVSSYVGRIMLGEVQITIRPKIRGAPLLQLLRYAYGLRDLKLLTETSTNSEELTFQDLLISQLIAETEELMARGLHRTYVLTEADLSNPRGRINLQQIAKQGGIIQATLPCTYHPRIEDGLINQILLQGLHLAAHLTSNTDMRLKLFRLSHLLQDSISPIVLNHHVLVKLHQQMNRLTRAYQPAITIIEMLYHGGGIALREQQPQVQIPGFLFDMNRFFQDLLARFLREHLPAYEVSEQYTMRDMLSYDPQQNPRHRHAPQLRPDYVIVHDGRVIAILDAKYRDLWEKDLPPQMLYQLAMYALSQPNPIDATILYPTLLSALPEARIAIRDPVRGTSRAFVVLRPVNLRYLAGLVSGPSTVDRKRKQAAFARQVAFGEATEENKMIDDKHPGGNL